MAEIALTNGLTAVVDDEDRDTVAGCGQWFAVKKGAIWYAARMFNDRRRVYMHTFIMMPDHSGLCIDHLNGDGRDNRKANLRVVGQSENQRNRAGPQINNRSGVRGVYTHSKTGKWVAAIRHRGVRISLGCYDSLEDARAARIAGEMRLWTENDRARSSK